MGRGHEFPSLIKALKLPQRERNELAEQFDARADELMQKAKTDPSLCEPYYNEDGERCPAPISVVGLFRQRARELRARK